MDQASDDRPRLRPLEGHPIEHNGEPLLSLHDPSHLSEFVANLPPTAVAIVQLCDGETTRDEICAQFFQRYRQKLDRATLDSLLSQLDDALLLDSPRFRQYAAGIFSEFARASVRTPLHAGRSYPKDPARLSAALDDYYTAAHGPGRPQPGSSPRPKAIIAPHVDFGRGGPAYAWAYRALADSVEDPPDLVVMFCTNHAGWENPFTLTRKHYDTPLGRLTTDVELVDKLAEMGGGDRLFADEHHHRGEHSAEFQAVWLRHVYGKRADAILALPILCGSFQSYILGTADPATADEVARFLSALVELTAGRKVLWLAGVDLAHVGPQYGDPAPLDEEDRKSLERRDQATLVHVVRGDARGWLDEIRREQDRRRVCGVSAVYGMLQAAQPGAGRLAAYAQCLGDSGSIVSIASVIY